MQMKGQAAIPSTTIIELSSKTVAFSLFSSCIPLSYIFHEIFISSSRELFPVVIDSANLNAVQEFADSEQDAPYFIRWKLHVDERVV